MNRYQRQSTAEYFRENPKAVGWLITTSSLSFPFVAAYTRRSVGHMELEKSIQTFSRVLGVRLSELVEVARELIADPHCLDHAFKYAFIGLKQAGKSTASTIASTIIGCRAVDTSDMIYEALAAESGVTVESLRAIPKEELRPRLIEIGDRLSKEDPLSLVRPVMKAKSFTIAGIRKKDQLAALPKDVQVVWINRTNHDPDSLDNLEIEPGEYDVVINNGASMSEFKYELCDMLLGLKAG